MNSKPQNSNKAQKRPKKITESYLYNSGLYYLQRFATSRAHFTKVMTRKIKKSCAFHKDQNFEECVTLLETVTQKLEDLGLLDDSAYTKGMITSLRRSGKSAKAIESKLAQKGLSAAKVHDTLSQFDAQNHDTRQDAEREAAMTFARKKRLGPFRKNALPTTPDEARALKQKELAALARAGFNYETARFILEVEHGELEDF